jgi:hypothetical protein
MKETIDGIRYNTADCETLASRDVYDNGNYKATISLELAPDGEYLQHVDAVARDYNWRDSLRVCEDPSEWLDGVDLTDEQEARLIELGLITYPAKKDEPQSRRVLLLKSYCVNIKTCTDEHPCATCLQLCNVGIVKSSDVKVVMGSLRYLKETPPETQQS